MTPTRRLQKAIHEYEQYVHDFSAFRARHVDRRDPDCSIEPIIEVPRSEALDRFLKIHPEYSDLRDRLLAVRGEQEMFFFVKRQWEDTCQI